MRLQYCRSNRRHLKPMALQRQARPRRCASGEGHSERCEIRAAEITQVRIGMRSAPIRNSLKRDSQGGAKRRRAEVGCSVRALPRAVVGHIGRPVSHFSSATANVGERGRQKARALSGVACGVGGVSSGKFSLDTRESRQCASCRDGRSRTQRASATFAASPVQPGTDVVRAARKCWPQPNARSWPRRANTSQFGRYLNAKSRGHGQQKLAGKAWPNPV